MVKTIRPMNCITDHFLKNSPLETVAFWVNVFKTSILAIEPIGEPKPPMLEPKNSASAYGVNLPTKIVAGTLLII